MRADLIEHFERDTWIQNEIVTLEKEIKTYFDIEPISIRHHFDLGTGNRIYKAFQNTAPPKGIQIRTGTIINEMRSILDALTCTLALRNGAKNLKSVYFPTAQSLEGLDDKKVKDKIRKLSDADKQLIRNLKPYIGGNDLLYTLHSADIIRKHQRLVVSSSTVSHMQVGEDEFWVLDGSKLIKIYMPENADFSKPVQFAELTPDYELKFKIVGNIIFSELDFIQGKDVIATLNNFRDLVHSILKLFDC